MVAPALQGFVNLRQRCGLKVRSVELLRVERIGDHLSALADELVEVRIAGGVLGGQRKLNGQADDVFICKCGEVIADPSSKNMLELHGPHFQAASLPQVHEALERWRDHARRTVEAASDRRGEA